jgi:hypothetical protein
MSIHFLKLPFKFYTDTKYQDENRAEHNKNSHFEYMLMPEMLLPFQIRRVKNVNVTFTVKIVCVGTLEETVITVPLLVVTKGFYDYIIHTGNTVELPLGVYYLHVYTSSQHWYSEYFNVVSSTEIPEETFYRISAVDERRKSSETDLRIYKL